MFVALKSVWDPLEHIIKNPSKYHKQLNEMLL